ncbi:MAG: hypothetical protein JRE56_12965 [Deltaproteobacteria bacterium]|jgi:hypothetical protein|nr:hypothetical protein [Deltaproteobacteria bacterium]
MESISLTAPFPQSAISTGSPLGGFYGPDAAPSASAGGWEDRIGLVEDYSDLEYTRIDLTVGGTYNFSDRLYTSASLTYSDFDSDEDYVYGDESGSSYYGYASLGYRF